MHPDKENYSSEELSQEEKIRPQSFKDFAGQRKTLDNLEVFVAAAKKQRNSIRPHASARASWAWEDHAFAYHCQRTGRKLQSNLWPCAGQTWQSGRNPDQFGGK